MIAELAGIDGDDDFLPPGTVPPEWLRRRLFGHLRTSLARETLRLGFEDFDAALLQQSVPRSLTQAISRVVNNQGLSGIRYLSRYGHDIENWAIFEPFAIEIVESKPLTGSDPDFQSALRIHRLRTIPV